MGGTVFISGPHGSGKTTLENNLIKESDDIICSDFDINFLKDYPSMKLMNAYERCLLRLYHRIYAGMYALRSNENNSKIILVNRSAYDSLVYSSVEYSLGEMSENEYNILMRVGKECISLLPYTIILNPPVDVIMERLNTRRKLKQRDERNILCDREDTYEYVKLTHDFFEEYKYYENVLYLTDNGNEELSKILLWFNKLKYLSGIKIVKGSII